MEIVLLITLVFLVAIIIILQILLRPKHNDNVLSSKIESFEKEISKIESGVREEIKENRQELGKNLTNFQTSFLEALNGISKSQLEQLKAITESNQQVLSNLNKTIEEKINALVTKTDENNKINRDELSKNIKEFTDSVVLQLDKITGKVEEKLKELNEQAKADGKLMRESLENSFKGFQSTFDKNVESFNNTQKDKFGQMEIKQNELIQNTEKKLEQMRETVDEKLQKTLNERLSQSFETVGKQLQSVQEGLGEMKTLAQDVGGLKKVLSNVRTRGGVGEVQLEMLLEQILAPDQYEANVKTKKGSNDSVEFAIKLPGRDENQTSIYLPIDAKFPKDAYENLLNAYDTADSKLIDSSSKAFDNAVKSMAKDICEKYLDPPNTTDFGIMFLPFESIYAEVVRKASLLEDLQRNFKIVVTGPTTLAAILNSLQMGFRTLAIQKRSSEVWQVLGAVKKEFENFGGMLQKAQNNFQTGLNQLDDVMGKRTRAIQRKLKGVEALTDEETKLILPEATNSEVLDDETEI
ncbi:MAG: DNA recombination protein RmuC [Salinivirgaceae bacterium]|nr:DNA recombination protein RmuC [Salinivirgaceae bacterium]